MSTSALGSISRELSCLQVNLLQRNAPPSVLACAAVRLLREQRDALEIRSDVDVHHVPLFLRSCGTLIAKLPPTHSLDAFESLDAIFPIASRYVHSKCGDVNESAAVLRGVLGLYEVQQRLQDAAPSSQARSMVDRKFASLLRPCYHHAYQQWSKEAPGRTHTLSVLSLLRGTAMLHGRDFQFPSMNPDQRGLLPIKQRVHMEAKMLRCPGSKELLNALKEMSMNRLDAGMCLTQMAELGFYDRDVCNMACEVLQSSHAIISSQQISQILYSLGVIQHRHVFQRFFSSFFVPKKCDAEGIRQHALGLAMLQQPPHSEEQLMDGIFLHALRYSKSRSHYDRHQQQHLNLSDRGALPVHSPSEVDKPLPYSWFLDVGYSLSCLDITHHKYKLLLSRQVRGKLPKMSTKECCKYLYAIGPPSDPEVPAALQSSWEKKVGKAMSFAFRKLEDIEVADGPQTMHALRFCGVMKHSRLPSSTSASMGVLGGSDMGEERQPSAERNPVEVLLQTWMTTPQEQIVHLAERIVTSDLIHAQRREGETPARQLAKICSVLGKACQSFSPNHHHRFASLCTSVDHFSSTMSVDESMMVLEGLFQVGLSADCGDTIQNIISRLRRCEDEMTETQKSHFEQLLAGVDDLSSKA